MDSTKFAEALLCMICGRNRASEIVGDLLEQHQSRYSFWREVMVIVAAMTWRWIAAFLLATISMMLILTQYAAYAMDQADHRIVMLPGSKWVLAGLCAWSVLVLNLIRFGWKDRINVLSLGAAALLFVMAGASKSHVEVYALLAVALYLIVCLFAKSLRSLFLCVAIPALSFALCFGLLARASSWRLDYPMLMAFQFLGICVTSLAFQAWALQAIRRRLFSSSAA